MSKLRGWTIAATVLSLSGCGSPEQSTVERFFLAAQSNDSATVAAMSAVAAPGPVESWQFVEITSQSRMPFELPELQRELVAAEKARDDQLDEGRQYLVANRAALDEIIPKLNEDSTYQFDGELGEIQKVWLEFVEDRKSKERAFQDLRRDVEAEVKLADRSVISDVTLESLEGEVAVTEVLAMITAPGDDEKPYTITLRKYELSRRNADRPEPSRWVIVDIQEKSPA